MTRYLPYLLPVFVTLAFVLACYSGHYWFGFILFPLIGFFAETLGKFSLEEVIDEYIFFHHTKGMEFFRGASAAFFLGLNIWIACFLHFNTLGWYNLTFFIYGIILLNSNFAISLAHDLMHSGYSVNRTLGSVLLLLNGFFYLETDHIYIHHRFVGTTADPASAMRNEALYTYLKRSITQRFIIIFFGNHKFSKDLQRRIRLKTLFRLIICISFLFLASLVSFQYLLCVLFQYVFVTLLYEVITYIQHYGLRRDSENVDLHHAWNCYYRLSAYMHYMMPVHSIHHLKTEPDLRKLTFTGPAFPVPFAKTAMLALRPKKWKITMEKALKAHGYED